MITQDNIDTLQEIVREVEIKLARTRIIFPARDPRYEELFEKGLVSREESNEPWGRDVEYRLTEKGISIAKKKLT
jgi:hypothetical protein